MQLKHCTTENKTHRYCAKSDMTTSFTSTVQLIEINGRYYLEIPKCIMTLFSLKTPKKFKLVMSENTKQEILFLHFAASYKQNPVETDNI